MPLVTGSANQAEANPPLPSPDTGMAPQLHSRLSVPASHRPGLTLHLATHTMGGTLSAPGGLVPLSGDGQEVNPPLRPRHASLSNLNSIVFLRSLSHWFYSCKLEFSFTTFSYESFKAQGVSFPSHPLKLSFCLQSHFEF